MDVRALLGTFEGAPISGCAGNSRVLASWTSKRSSYHFNFFIDISSEKGYLVGSFLPMVLSLLTKRRKRTSYGAIVFFIGLSHALLWLVIPIQPSTATLLKQPANNGTIENNEKQPPVESLGNLEQITHRISRGDTLAISLVVAPASLCQWHGTASRRLSVVFLRYELSVQHPRDRGRGGYYRLFGSQ